jgi:5-methylthioadenosine/S-adenosylhomocysteine deaminase
MTTPPEVPEAPNAPAHADILLHARWMLPMEGARKVLEHYSLAITGQYITAIAPRAQLQQRIVATREIELENHVLLPGMINAHGHAPMSLLRGFADDLPLQPWLEQKIWPAESRWVNEEFVAAGARLAIAEMLLSGTTTFSDMYYFPDQVAKVAGAAGIRVQLACPVLDFPTVWARDAEDYIAKATRLHDEYRNSERIRVAFGPHAPYTVSDEPLLKIAMLAEELDIGIHMHIHENAQEISDAMHATGMRPLTRLKQLEFLGPRLQAVHLTQLLPEEIELLARLGVHAVHCPASNLKLASGFCPVTELLRAGVNVALGTDGCASNNNLDMFSELRLAALLEKGRTGDAGSLPAWQALQMATINGARAMGLEDKIGSLETGKLADVIAVDLGALASQPIYDPVSALVYGSNSNQVTHSWIHGQAAMENRQLTRMHVGDIQLEARDWGKRMAEQAAR